MATPFRRAPITALLHLGALVLVALPAPAQTADTCAGRSPTPTGLSASPA